MFIANWKMNKTQSEARAFCEAFLKIFTPSPNGTVDVGIAPPYTAIETAKKSLGNTPGIDIGAQNVHWLSAGAQTGEISAPMLKEIGVSFVIIGHSERRQYYGESSKFVAARALNAIKHGLHVIACIGESAADFERGVTREVVYEQLVTSLEGLKPQHTSQLTIAYEPVWAVGTGHAATPEIIAKVHTQIHDILSQLFGKEEGKSLPIIYGGSTTPDNIYEIMCQEHVSGALVGGASLDPQTFNRLILNGRKAKSG